MTVYPMMLEQESIWLDDYLTDGPSRYLESWAYRFTGPVDRAAVHWAWEAMTARHDGLRSTFGLDGDVPVQRVRPVAQRPPLVVRPCAPDRVEQTVRELVTAPMDVNSEAVRATLLEVSADTVVLVVQMHHIVIDDWSLHLLDRQFEEHYRAFTEGRQVVLEPVQMQPGPYALLQRSARTDPAALRYWRTNLAELPADVPDAVPAGERSGAAERLSFAIDGPLARGLRRLCGRLRTTPFTVFAAATAVLLCEDGAGADLLISTPVSRRSSAECDQMIAPLTQLLPLRLRVPPEASFADLVAQARTKTHEALEFGGVTSAELVQLTRRRGRSRGGLGRAAVVLDDAADAGITIPQVTAERLFVFSGFTKIDLCFYFSAVGSGYHCMLDYAVDRYRPAVARHLADRMLTLLDTVAADPSAAVALIIDPQSPAAGTPSA